MRKLSPADDLAELRAEIARLRARESALRNALLAAPERELTGRWNRVEIETARVLVFDPQLLPPGIHQHPGYWREQVTRIVRCLPIQPRALPPRPGWPIRRDEMEGDALH